MASTTAPELRTHNDYTVGWVCALSKEQTAATAMLDQKHPNLPKPPNDPNVYTLGSIWNHNIVIACLPQGEIATIPAATVSTWMISTFPSIKFGLMVGIGGGIPPKVRLGDVVVSAPVGQFSGVVQWDRGKGVHGNFERTGSLNNPPISLRAALNKLQTEHEMNGPKIPDYLQDLKQKWPRLAAKYLKSDLLEDNLFRADYEHISEISSAEEEYDSDDEEEGATTSCKFCDKTRTVKRKPRDMRIHYGLIASGNQVIKDAAIRDKLKKDLGNHVLCIEMEAAGLMNNFPCMVIRGICDYADSHKNDAWQEHAAAVAAAFAKELLEYVQPSDVNGERSVKDIVGQILDTTSRTEAKITTAISKLNKKEDLEILRWITTFEYGSQQSDNLRRRQAGTGEWLLNSKEFQEWRNGSSKTLFCPGIPGAGKTIITSIIINHLEEQLRCDTTVGVAYIYCNFQSKRGAEDMIQSLLKQLSQGQPSLPKAVKDLYERHRPKQTRPLLHEISKTLKSVAAIYSKVFIIVDALDECQASNRCRQTLLSEIFSLQAATGTNFFATSRHIPEIKDQFNGTLSLEIRAHDEDVRRYVEDHISDVRTLNWCDPNLREIIKSVITKAVDGMFLLAQLYLQFLADKTTPSAVKAALHQFQNRYQGSGEEQKLAVLTQAYDDAMNRIRQQSTDFTQLAERIISWITYAKRSLTVRELQHALAVEVGKSELDPDNCSHIDLVIFVCNGLVTVDEESNIIRLVHYTTQEYFEQSGCRWFPDAQTDLAITCVAYLSFDTFESGHCRTVDAFEEKLQLHPLYDYAAQNWGRHAYALSKTNEQVILEYLESNAKVLGASQAMLAPALRWICGHQCSQEVPRRVTGLHLAAYFGLEYIVKALLARKQNPYAQDTNGRTPLFYAAKNGHAAVVKFLLTVKGTYLQYADNYGQTILSYAARRGSEAVVTLLLDMDGINVDAKSISGQTPLSHAAENGHEAVVKLLLASNCVDPNSPNLQLWTPLSYAVDAGHEGIVKLLLGTDSVNPDAEDWGGITPLSHAASIARKAVVVLLLASKGVNLNSKGSKSHYDTSIHAGRTPLSWAAARGSVGVVELLLAKHGVDLDCKDANGRTPLSYAAQSYAAQHRTEAVVKLLLANNQINPDSSDDSGRTPLSYAAEHGSEGVVNLLLAKDINPDSKDSNGWTPLSYAAREGNDVVVKLLLATDRVNPNSQDTKGRTPLSRAATWHKEATVMLLLATSSVDPDLKSNDGRTALSYAVCEYGRLGVIQLLLANSLVDPNSKDTKGRTPLSWAAEHGLETEVMATLLAKDNINLDSRDNDNRTPLSYAAGNGETAIVELLLASNQRVDAGSKDLRGRTPLSYAAEKGNKEVIDLLLATGQRVNADSKDNSGRTPLSYAAGNGKAAIVELLLATNSVDANSLDSNHRTPLSWAAEIGNVEMVNLLLTNPNVDSEIPDKDGQTPFSRAVKSVYVDIETKMRFRNDISALPATIHNSVSGILLARYAIDLRLGAKRNKISEVKGNWQEVVLRLILANEKIEQQSCSTEDDWLEMMKRLLMPKNGIDLNFQDSSGRTLLWWAAEVGHESMVQLLLTNEDINLDVKGGYGRTPLSCAANNGHTAIVQALLTRTCINLNSRDYGGQTALLHAIRNGHKAIVELLLTKDGIDVESKDKRGRISLWWALKNGHESIVRLLLANKNMNSSLQAKRNMTAALWQASWTGHEEIIELLLAKGGMVSDSKSEKRISLLWAAAYNGHVETVKFLLEKYCVEPDSKDKNGQSPLWAAARNGHVEIVRLLVLEYGVEIDSKDANGESPLWAASGKGHAEIVEFLLAKGGVDIHCKDKLGRTPVSCAMEYGHRKIVELLWTAEYQQNFS